MVNKGAGGSLGLSQVALGQFPWGETPTGSHSATSQNVFCPLKSNQVLHIQIAPAKKPASLFIVLQTDQTHFGSEVSLCKFPITPEHLLFWYPLVQFNPKDSVFTSATHSIKRAKRTGLPVI